MDAIVVDRLETLARPVLQELALGLASVLGESLVLHAVGAGYLRLVANVLQWLWAADDEALA